MMVEALLAEKIDDGTPGFAQDLVRCLRPVVGWVVEGNENGGVGLVSLSRVPKGGEEVAMTMRRGLA